MFMVLFAMVFIVQLLISATRRCRLSYIVNVNFSMIFRFDGALTQALYISVLRMTFIEATSFIF